MAKRRTQRQILEDRLRTGGMEDGDLADVLRAFDAGHRRPADGRFAVVAIPLLEGRPFTIPRKTIDDLFGPGHDAFELRPFRRRDGAVAASLRPVPAVRETFAVPADEDEDEGWVPTQK